MSLSHKIAGKTILIVGGGLLQVPIIQTARMMKLTTVVADMNGDAPGMKICDVPMVMSTKDIEGMVRESKKLATTIKIDGVITAGTDASMTVAAVANALDLPGIRYVDAEAASNKVKMRERLKKAGIPLPGFAPVWSFSDARDALEFLKFPLVMKPADNMGARGVIKVENREELQAAFKHAKKYSPTGEMILEEYMPGPEVSVDALTWNGNFVITGIADRIIEREPFFIEMGHNMPSALNSSVLKEVEDVMFRSMKALGITIGAGKGDIKVTPDGVKVGEIAARLSGGFMSAFTFPLSSGINLNRAAILIALGEEPDNLTPTIQRVSIERCLLAPRGKLLAIDGIEEVRKMEGVNDLFFMNKIGDIIREPTNNIEKTGHVIISADTLKQAESVFEKVKNTIRFTCDELYSVSEKEIQQNARLRFGKEVCWVCKVCDGTDCASGVPGMGGLGRMLTFQDNINALREYSILPKYIREHIQAVVKTNFLGKVIQTPVMAAPMTGAVTNMNGAMDEFTFAATLLEGCRTSGTLAWLGDGASPEKYLIMLEAVRKTKADAILICKPREDEGLLEERFRESENSDLFAIGMDVDAVNFRTMMSKNISSVTRNVSRLGRIRSLTKLPFIIKGIMTPQDAQLAIDAGADCIVVSNHGGRVLDDMPGTARVLPGIRKVIGDKVQIAVDGGVRSGMDVFKMIALGADTVLIGRPMAIFAIGGGVAGIRFLISQYTENLLQSMNVTGVGTLKEIGMELLFRKKMDEENSVSE
ncbi:alpha-hydroxy-acid oxidizing protein [Leptospira borgpetersenii]|uniref:Phosphoribosylamine--glycine ligase-like protein n=2 Tax=Leptospira borgpetersenii TaxID=174 RepID=M3H423_LEPBO|nr:alpha-hydroxy-acid oxidizing protein [Leptospira borgpetersenii]EKP14965.1 phosphoribosylamine--glycine ligase-like protein [Leptospira borgpetersenii str. 200801926]EMG01844.1 phosphoribosylamine--glycine ligase-like protein [Leptospira borgpetersenii str. 200701203]ENO62286.1 phosphoribosylamine--glycine ligase-like protein [Leptospira borgpetersenii serovar Mini str. 201000851]